MIVWNDEPLERHDGGEHHDWTDDDWAMALYALMLVLAIAAGVGLILVRA